jgi:hypothetical protein
MYQNGLVYVLYTGVSLAIVGALALNLKYKSKLPPDAK